MSYFLYRIFLAITKIFFRAWTGELGEFGLITSEESYKQELLKLKIEIAKLKQENVVIEQLTTIDKKHNTVTKEIKKPRIKVDPYDLT